MKKTNQFTLRDYKINESDNNHTANAVALVNMFGTKEEKEAIDKIASNHLKRGYLGGEEVKERHELSNKYYHLLK